MLQSYKGKINTNFHNNEIPKEGSQRICLSVILIDSVYRKDKHYYPQVFLHLCSFNGCFNGCSLAQLKK